MGAAAKVKTPAKGLGRGLDALLGDGAAPKRAKAKASDETRELPIEHIQRNPEQPRRVFDDAAIEELADSIRARGLLQPILVRPMGEDAYEIVAGERRWRAAQKAQLHAVPVVVRELTDEEAGQAALIENVQRVDLDPIEEAEAYRRLTQQFGRKQDEIAAAVGKSRSHIANLMRLLNLPESVRDALTAGRISMGHARALIGAKDAAAICKKIEAKALSVRETEQLVRDNSSADKGEAKTSNSSVSKSKGASGAPKDADTRALENDLAAVLGLEVSIEHNKKGSGSVRIDYLSLDQLDDICRRLMGAGV